MLGEADEVAIDVVVDRLTTRRARGRMTIVEATVSDQTGSIRAVWFNQPWVADQLVPGDRVSLVGSLRKGAFSVRSHERRRQTLVPVYRASDEIAPTRLRRIVAASLPAARDYWDPLPAELKERERLPSKPDAVRAVHEPASLAAAELGRRRLAFEELLVLQVGLARRRSVRERRRAAALPPPGALLGRYRAELPFRLTPDQERAIAEIDADLARPVPMERLLQGDVGSGKTVVALYTLLRAVESGRQGALMAPTETLAEQHFLAVEDVCARLGVPCILLTSSLRGAERRTARAAIAGGEAGIAVGTHALIQHDVEFRDLAVAVVDEQHRFGVEQRRALAEGRSPHALHMTATPIPRTLALTVYGDLAVTEITRPPADRKPVVTSWVTAERSSEAYTRLRRHLERGRQAYVVCPLVSESEQIEARAAESEAERLRRAELRGFRVGCLHGRLSTAARRELMRSFKAGELDVLVATTVIEVGVDVPNATIMIVQEADRFGLAQLHQLRGRVGRGAEQSYCLLVSRPKAELTEVARARLEALVASTDGFALAERDLELRGAGELLGNRQSGLTDFRFARLVADRPLLELARREAAALVADAGPLADEARRLFEGIEDGALA